MKFKFKHNEVEAIQFLDTFEQLLRMRKFTKHEQLRVSYRNPSHPKIFVNGYVNVGDWIVRADNGECHPLPQSVFEAMFEPVKESEPSINQANVIEWPSVYEQHEIEKPRERE